MSDFNFFNTISTKTFMDLGDINHYARHILPLS
jgi:hypothetical protein